MIKIHFFQLINIIQWWIPKNKISPTVKLIFMQLVQPMLTAFHCVPYLIPFVDRVKQDKIGAASRNNESKNIKKTEHIQGIKGWVWK